MNWSALTKKQKQMAIATAVVAVVQIFLLAHLLGWTRPASERGGSAKEELLDLQQKIEDARGFMRRTEMIERELISSIEKLDDLSVYTPTRSDRYAWAYEYVSKCATEAGVDLDSLEEIVFLGDETKGDGVEGPYEIGVSTLCGYNNLIQFLWRLETGNNLLRIKEVTVSVMRDDPQVHQVRVTMQWPASLKINRGSIEKAQTDGI